MLEFLTFPYTFSIDTGKEEGKENMNQDSLEEKRPIKTSRSKGKQRKAEKHDPRINSSSVQNGRQEIQAAEHGANEDMNLMQMTSVLKDLQSLSTALLTTDRESEDSLHSI